MKLNYIKRKIDNPNNQKVQEIINGWIKKGKAEKINEKNYKIEYEDRLGNGRYCKLFFDGNEIAILT